MQIPRRRDHGIEPRHWENRTYFEDMRPFLDEVRRCDPACSPNYLATHIGVYHSGKGRDFNFVALKGSRTKHFSIEIKTDEDPVVLQELEARGWEVEPYDSVRGYRVHLPEKLSDAGIRQLQTLMHVAYVEWPTRNGR